ERPNICSFGGYFHEASQTSIHLLTRSLHTHPGGARPSTNFASSTAQGFAFLYWRLRRGDSMGWSCPRLCRQSLWPPRCRRCCRLQESIRLRNDLQAGREGKQDDSL